MDVTTAIGGAIATTKTLVGLTRAAAGAAVDHQVKDRIIEVQQGILDLQGQLGDAQAERLQLLEEVHELRRKLRAAEAARARLDAYELQELAPGKFVYRLRPGYPEVPHLACPVCYGGGRISVLQVSHSDGLTEHVCGVCKQCVTTGTYLPPQLNYGHDPY